MIFTTQFSTKMIVFIFLIKYSFSDDSGYANYVVQIQNPQIGDFEEFVKREQFTAEAFRYDRSYTLFKIRGDKDIIVNETAINSILIFDSCHVGLPLLNFCESNLVSRNAKLSTKRKLLLRSSFRIGNSDFNHSFASCHKLQCSF